MSEDSVVEMDDERPIYDLVAATRSDEEPDVEQKSIMNKRDVLAVAAVVATTKSVIALSGLFIIDASMFVKSSRGVV